MNGGGTRERQKEKPPDQRMGQPTNQIGGAYRYVDYLLGGSAQSPPIFSKGIIKWKLKMDMIPRVRKDGDSASFYSLCG